MAGPADKVDADRLHVLFVCMGNICRSPTAHGVFRQRVTHAGLAERVSVDSAGTHDYHPGEPPDQRSQAHARRRGYDLADLRARALRASDFEQADFIVVMDDANFALTTQRCPAALRPKIHRMTAFCSAPAPRDVPDPYSGGPDGFERVLDLVEDGCDGLLQQVRQRLKAPR
jgi:protein-tyrosine phosphatase